MTDETLKALVDDEAMLALAEGWAQYEEPFAESSINLAKWVLKVRAALTARLAEVEAERDRRRDVIQALLDTIKGSLDTHTNIADHPNVKFAQMKMLDWANAAGMLWVVLANVSGGDWTQQSAEWQEAAARWRDNYFTVAHPPSPRGDQATR